MPGNDGSRPISDRASVADLPDTTPVPGSIEPTTVQPAAPAGPVADLGAALRGVLKSQPDAASPAAVRYAGSPPMWSSVAVVGGNEPGSGMPGMELAGAMTHKPDHAHVTLKTVLDSMEPTPAMKGLPRWQELVTIEQGEDGSIVFKATNYVEGGEQKLSALRTFSTLPTTIKMARVAVAALKKGDEITFNRIAALWGAALLHIAQIKVTVRGLEHLDPDKPYLFAPTHESMVEYGVHLLILNAFNLGYLLKDEFVKNPLLSSQFKGVITAAPQRFIVVDRANKAAGDAVVEAMAEAYAKPDNAVSLIVYPQGTRAKGRVDEHDKRVDGDLFAKGSLRAGVGRVVKRMQEMQLASGREAGPVEVVPITANGIGQVVAKGQFAAKLNTPVEFVISPPQRHVLTAANKDTLVAEVVAGVEAEFRRHRTSPQTAPEFVRWPVKVKKGHIPVLKSWDDLSRLLTGAGNNRVPAKKDFKTGKVSVERMELNNYLDQFRQAFLYIEMRDESGLTAWCKQKNVAEIYVQELYQRVRHHDEGKELTAVYARHRIATHKAKVFGFRAFPVGAVMSDRVYTREQMAELGGAYTGQLRRIWKIVRDHIGVFAQTMKFAGSDGGLASLGKAAMKLLALRYPTPKGAYSVLPAAVDEMIPEDARLDPISRETIVQVLTAYLNDHQVTEVPEVLKAAIHESYGFDSATEAAYLDFTLRYLQFIHEDGDRFLRVYEKDAPVNSSMVDVARVQAGSSFAAIRWMTEPLPEYVFPVLREQQEVAWLKHPPEGDAKAVQLFNVMVAAEEELARLVPEYLHDSAGVTILAAARDDVVRAMDAYATHLGMAANHETFSFLHRPSSGLALPVVWLKHIIGYDPNAGRRDIGRAVLVAHQNLVETKSGQAEKNYASSMRTYLDMGAARHVQAELMRLYAAVDAFLHHPTTFMAKVFARAQQLGTSLDSAESRAYAKALQIFKKLQFNSANVPVKDLSSKKQMGLEQARQAVNAAAVALVHTEDGMVLADLAQGYISLEKVKMVGLETALDTHHTYWRARNQWTAKEKARQEAMLREQIEHVSWKLRRLGEMYAEQTRLVWQGAEGMMAKAKAKLAGASAAQVKEFNTYEALYQAALAVRLGSMNGKVTQTPEENFAEQLHKVLGHYEDLLDPDRPREEKPNGHSVNLNRAAEAMGLGAIPAFFAARNALSAVTGQASSADPLAFLSKSFASKLAPHLDPEFHRKAADNLLIFMEKGVAPAVAEGLWRLLHDLPADRTEFITRWGHFVSQHFHQLKLADHTGKVGLPGEIHYVNGDHTGGWFMDYAATFWALGAYILTSKGSLDSTIPEPLGSGVPLVAQMLDEKTSQAAATAMMISMMMLGVNQRLKAGTLTRAGSHDVASYGSLTMSVFTDTDVAHLMAPKGLLNMDWTTGYDLPDNGRPRDAVLGLAAVAGTRARVANPQISTNYGGGRSGTKPDKPTIITPDKTAHVVVQDFDAFADPVGLQLMHGQGPLTHWQILQTGAVLTAHRRGAATMGEAVRRIRNNGYDPSKPKRATLVGTDGGPVVDGGTVLSEPQIDAGPVVMAEAPLVAKAPVAEEGHAVDQDVAPASAGDFVAGDVAGNTFASSIAVLGGGVVGRAAVRSVTTHSLLGR